jgi:hypothetical protein
MWHHTPTRMILPGSIPGQPFPPCVPWPTPATRRRGRALQLGCCGWEGAEQDAAGPGASMARKHERMERGEDHRQDRERGAKPPDVASRRPHPEALVKRSARRMGWVCVGGCVWEGVAGKARPPLSCSAASPACPAAHAHARPPPSTRFDPAAHAHNILALILVSKINKYVSSNISISEEEENATALHQGRRETSTRRTTSQRGAAWSRRCRWPGPNFAGMTQ